MNKLALAVCVALACSPAMAKRNIVVVDGDKINVVADPRGQGNGVRDNPKACMQSALACTPVVVVDPPVVQPPVVQPPVVQPPTTEPPVVVPPTVTPPVVQPPVVQPPVTPPVAVPPTPVTPVVPVNPGNGNPQGPTAPVNPATPVNPEVPSVSTPQTPVNGITVMSQRAVPCIKDWAFCKEGTLKENRATGSVIDEIVFYEID